MEVKATGVRMDLALADEGFQMMGEYRMCTVTFVSLLLPLNPSAINRTFERERERERESEREREGERERARERGRERGRERENWITFRDSVHS